MTKFKHSGTEGATFYELETSLFRDLGYSQDFVPWGYFENLSDTSSSRAKLLSVCKGWRQYMLQRSDITAESTVLEVGCGNGSTAIWLAKETGCKVVGIDLSPVQINHAQNEAKDYPTLTLSFQKASVTDLPFDDATFTHVWSQGALYRSDDRTTALQEIQRVLQEAGTLIFDDLVTPAEISKTTRQQVYERLLFEPTFSPESFREILTQQGLMVTETKDLSPHLLKSHQLLTDLASPDYPDLSATYNQICQAIEKQELGWSFYLCHKVSDRLTWIHENQNTQELKNKYDAWAKLYETDIGKSWSIMPMNATAMLKQLLPQEDICILDAGAGSGMVGEALAKQGYNNIMAIDLSSEMLEIAKQKQVYQTLLEVNLEQPLTFSPPESFDAILAIGVFTYGHASPTGLYNLLPMLKQGGIFILTVRLSNKPMQESFHKLPWTLIAEQEYLFEGAPFQILAYRKD